MQQGPTYSLIVPVFNEEAVLPLLLPRLERLLGQLDAPAEVIFVDDGSSDLSGFILEQQARTDRRFRYAALSRNFGHQIAVTTGLDLASGAAVIIMDADLQDPPELALDLIAKWKEGFEVVSAQRLSRAGESRFKRATATLFYRILNTLARIEIPRDVGDFRLVDRRVVDVFRAMPERDRFVRGMFAWVGFKQATVAFDRPPRAAGRTKYSLLKMGRLAGHGIISFSDVPLRLALWCGIAVSGLAMLYGLYVIALRVFGAQLVPGWSSIIVVTAFLGGANMFMTGLMGLYVGRIYSEVKGRPLYLIDRSIGFGADQESTDRTVMLPSRTDKARAVSEAA